MIKFACLSCLLVLAQFDLISGCEGAGGCQQEPETPTGQAQADVQPDSGSLQICVTNQVADHTLTVTLECEYNDPVLFPSGQLNVSAQEKASLTVPSGQTRYIVCPCQKTPFGNLNNLVNVDFNNPVITFDQDTSVSQSLSSSTVTVVQPPATPASGQVQCGQQLRFVVTGTPPNVTVTPSSGDQSVLPGSQVVQTQ